MDAASAAIGFATGILAGFLGVGGGAIIVPLLLIFLSLTPEKAVGTSLLAIVLISAVSTQSHRRYGFSLLKEGLVMGLSGAVGTFVGAVVLEETSLKSFSMLFACLLLYTAYNMLRRAATEKKNRQAGNPMYRSPVFWVLFGFLAGVLGGFFGVGGGMIMVPYLAVLAGYDRRDCVGASCLAISVIALSGTIVHFLRGNINLEAGIYIGIFGAAGSVIGAWLLERMRLFEERRRVRLGWIFYGLFSLLLLAAAAKMLL